MNDMKKPDSKHASIHDIVNQNKNKLRKMQINQLFQAPDLSEFDTSEFHHHHFMISNDIFTFFVHELQKWNKKIRNKQVTPFCKAQLSRNSFVYSSLKIICLKKPNQIGRYLQELTKWYSKNSYNIPQPSVLMKKYNPNEEWQVRKTFRSNTPSEINNYRRRYLCSPDTKDPNFVEIFQVQKKKQNCFFEVKSSMQKSYKNYKTCENFSLSQEIEVNNDQLFNQMMKNKDSTLARLRNNQIRKQRQSQQIKTNQDSWRKQIGRFGQRTCKNFFKGKFKHNKQFMDTSTKVEPRKIQTASYNNRFSQQNANLISQIKKGRLKTSLGVRKNFIHQQKQGKLVIKQISGLKTQNNQETKQNCEKWIDSFIVDQDKIDLRNTLNYDNNIGMKLISNPFEIGKGKMKKRKK